MQHTPPRPGARAPGTLLDRLRLETRALHDEVESVVPILRPEADEAAYRGFLEKLLGYHRPVERDLLRVPGLEPLHLADRLKAPLLARDLVALGRTAAEVAALPDCPRTPALPATRASLGAALGVAYVLEGSALGAQVVLKMARERWPRVADGAAAYLRGSGRETRARWEAFGVELLALTREGPPGVEDQAVAAARETFSTLRDWLAPP